MHAAAPPVSRWPVRYSLIGLCVLSVFVCYIDRVNISVAVLAMQEEFGWSESLKGLVLSAFFFGYMFFMPASGWLANRLGGRRVLGYAVLWWSLWTILTPRGRRDVAAHAHSCAHSHGRWRGGNLPRRV